MGRTQFDPKNQRQDASNYPKLKLEKDGFARVLLIESDGVWEEWAHTLRAPKILNGVPQTEVKRRMNGEEYTDYVYEFIGRPICLGDSSVLMSAGVDPKNCPVCEYAAQTGNVKGPERRFAAHVIKYQTKPNSTDISTPFGVSLLVWAFSERTYDKLTGFRSEWGDLKKHDLLLGPCTNPQFQQFDINIAGKAEWLASDDRKKLVVDTFRENKATDQILSDFCGRTAQQSWVIADIDKIKDRWATINGFTENAMGADAAIETNLSDDLDSLLTSQTSMDSVSETITDDTAPSVDVSTPEPVKETVDFDDLLKGV